MTLRRALALAALAAALAPAAARADTTISTLPGPTAVRAWGGTALLSLLDPASGRYQLATSRGGAAPQAIPGIAPAADPFDADIGPGPDGSAVIVYARCAKRACQLFRTTPAGGAETPVAGATSRDGSETAPTVWRGRLAFARTYARGSSQVYVRPLDAPASVRSTRLPGLPRRTCDEVNGCHAITNGTVSELELRGTSLAESVTFPLRTVGICGERQIRLVDVVRRSSALVADTICGLGGQTFVGVSWAGSQLLFARTCPGDPGGCRDAHALAYRYTPPSRRTEIVKQPGVMLGFAALDATHALEVRAPNTKNGTCDNYDPSGPHPACDFVSAGPLPYGAASSRAR